MNRFRKMCISRNTDWPVFCPLPEGIVMKWNPTVKKTLHIKLVSTGNMGASIENNFVRLFPVSGIHTIQSKPTTINCESRYFPQNILGDTLIFYIIGSSERVTSHVQNKPGPLQQPSATCPTQSSFPNSCSRHTNYFH